MPDVVVQNARLFADRKFYLSVCVRSCNRAYPLQGLVAKERDACGIFISSKPIKRIKWPLLHCLGIPTSNVGGVKWKVCEVERIENMGLTEQKP